MSIRLNTQRRNVKGLTVVDRKLFVVHFCSNIIRVFEINGGRSERLKDIVVENMNVPNDIVGCKETLQLFVADYRAGRRGVIWRIDLKRYDQMSSGFIQTQDYKPWRLSLSRGRRLIVTPFERQPLFVYDVVDGRLLERIQLPGFMWPRHAIETKRGTFIVCHEGEDHDEVSEVDREAHVIRSCWYCQHQLKLYIGGHMAIDLSERVLVADWGNARILLLTEHLEYDRILIDKKRGDFNSKLNRLYYDEQNKQLMIGFDDGEVNIYEWK